MSGLRIDGPIFCRQDRSAPRPPGFAGRPRSDRHDARCNGDRGRPVPPARVQHLDGSGGRTIDLCRTHGDPRYGAPEPARRRSRNGDRRPQGSDREGKPWRSPTGGGPDRGREASSAGSATAAHGISRDLCTRGRRRSHWVPTEPVGALLRAVTAGGAACSTRRAPISADSLIAPDRTIASERQRQRYGRGARTCHGRFAVLPHSAARTAEARQWHASSAEGNATERAATRARET